MAEFCKECFKRCIEPGALDEYIIVSDDEDFCEGCGEFKQVVIEYNPEEVNMNNELNIFTGGYMPWYPCNWWSNIRYFFRTIKWGWQRATKGYSDYDTWNLDVYYSNMMIASLSQFREETMGYPGYMNDIEEWYAILDKIIFLLKQANEDEPLEEKNELSEWYEEYLETDHLTMTEVANGKAMRISLKDVDEETEAKRKQYYKREEELYNIRTQKRKEAFDLLAEYFGHLWW